MWHLQNTDLCDVVFFLTVVNCGTLTNPTNGQVSHTGGTTYGQTATYSCNTGYNLVGNSTRTCQATRMWSGRAPTCQGEIVIGKIEDSWKVVVTRIWTQASWLEQPVLYHWHSYICLMLHETCPHFQLIILCMRQDVQVNKLQSKFNVCAILGPDFLDALIVYVILK